MSSLPVMEQAKLEGWSDEEVVRRVIAGEQPLFEILMRRHNQRVYRAVRSILRDDGESEDVMQEAYVSAYQHLAQFEGRSQFSTWLTRIAVNEALKRLSARKRLDPLDDENFEGEDVNIPAWQSKAETPEVNASRTEVNALLEEAILALPQKYRAVIILRDVEEMNTAEAAEALSLTESNVKVRLHRAHELLRQELFARAGAASTSAFGFHATRCDRVVKNVFDRLNGSATR